MPDCVGVPLITPVELASVTPLGREPLASDQANAGPVPPVSVRVTEYGAVTSPAGTDVVLTEGGGGGGGLITRL